MGKPGSTTRILVVNQTGNRTFALEHRGEEMRVLNRVTNTIIIVWKAVLPIGPVIGGRKSEDQLNLIDPLATMTVDEFFNERTATTRPCKVPALGCLVIGTISPHVSE